MEKNEKVAQLTYQVRTSVTNVLKAFNDTGEIQGKEYFTSECSRYVNDKTKPEKIKEIIDEMVLEVVEHIEAEHEAEKITYIPTGLKTLAKDYAEFDFKLDGRVFLVRVMFDACVQATNITLRAMYSF